MTLKKLHENKHSYSILGNSKPWLRKATLKHGIDNEFNNLLSELCLDSTEGNLQLPEVVKQRKKKHRSLARTLACKKKAK